MEPDGEFLCWIQFEDFVSVFNRVNIVDDLSWSPNFASRRYLSKWVVGDFVAGSGGPPSERLLSFDSGEDAGLYSPREGQQEEEDEDDEDDESSIDKNADPFTDNPMYPFSVTEPSDLVVSLYQGDRRWSVARVSDDPLDVSVYDYAVRGGRVASACTYPVAVGLVVLRLSGLKMRVTTFKLKKIVASSFGILHSNVVSTHVRLLPGRYAIVPFTHQILPFNMDYAISCQFLKGTIEFEINDIIKERPIDTVPSDDEDDNETTQKPKAEPVFSVPEEAPSVVWEWKEDSEEMGILSVYEQVGDLARQLRRLRNEVAAMTKAVADKEFRAKNPDLDPTR